MRAVVQRVRYAKVEVEGAITGEIGKGLLVLLGVMEGDTKAHSAFLAKKVAELRIFTDAADKMNLSVQDVSGGVLVISQFTLAADCSHGRRPSFFRAAPPAEADLLYRDFVEKLTPYLETPVATGVFGAHMEVSLLNEGPVTIILDTKEMGFQPK